jgi:catechol 2,3-dioxygenase-like lactoylglutathione lyase family enzyme
LITEIRHVGIVVVDLERALSFWCDALGFRLHKRMDESGSYIDAMMGLEDVRVTTVKLQAPDGNLVELLHFRSHPDRPSWNGNPCSTGLTHLALTVDDLDSECRRLSDAGVTFDAPPQPSPDGYAKVTYGRGPEGILLELVEVLQK